MKSPSPTGQVAKKPAGEEEAEALEVKLIDTDSLPARRGPTKRRKKAEQSGHSWKPDPPGSVVAARPKSRATAERRSESRERQEPPSTRLLNEVRARLTAGTAIAMDYEDARFERVIDKYE